jgi:hypothetical protein
MDDGLILVIGFVIIGIASFFVWCYLLSRNIEG